MRLTAPGRGVITSHLVMLTPLSPALDNRLNDEDRMAFVGSPRVL